MRVSADAPVIIVGAGLAGLACARRLKQSNIPFLILEAEQDIGGRIKTEKMDGFLLNYGFQVLQTAYPEARRILDFDRLDLKPFAPGAMIRLGVVFYRISDPMRRPRDLFQTLQAPIGNLADRWRILRLARNVRRHSVSDLFNSKDMPTIEFLRSQGFSDRIIQKFFKPFFAGVCLDPEIRASSRVFQYIFRIFAEGDVALPGQGMAAIVDQLADHLPSDCIRTAAKVDSIHSRRVVLASGDNLAAAAVVLATDAPETARLVGRQIHNGSRGEICLYFAAHKPPVDEPYLILNGDGTGRINSVTVPSIVAPTYAPADQHLISVVVIGRLDIDDPGLEDSVRRELFEWFGPVVDQWRHLKTYRIDHALPTQAPPVSNPTSPAPPIKPGIFVCGEFNGIPGIQWAMLSGRHAAEQVLTEKNQ